MTRSQNATSKPFAGGMDRTIPSWVSIALVAIVASGRRHLSLFFLLTASAIGEAQTVRGTVTDGTTGLPVAGGVVILERLNADSSAMDSRSVLTSRDGTFSIRAAGPGSARLHARRIGAMPFRSELLSLADGEVRVVDVQMERVAPTGTGSGSTLGRVYVRRGTPCRTTDDGEYIATLWDDARTALMVTEIAGNDRKPSRRLVRYVRELDIPSLRVFAESLHAFDGTDTDGATIFGSRSGEELSREGYWYEDRNGAVNFFGPDASALLSEAFVRDHCFRIAADADSGNGLIALTFEPVPARTREYTPAEIAGVVWFDAATSELRQIEFDWTRLRADTSLVGGDVRFAHDSSGVWYVSSWRLRMPREVLLVSGQGVVGRRQTLLEEGGVVLDDLPTSGFVPGTITGVVRDSKGRGLAEAVVRVIGAGARAVTDQQGRYTLTGVPPGLQFVVADHESYQDLGIRLGQHRALITEGIVRDLLFSAPTTEVAGSILCGSARRPPNTAILRVSIANTVSETPTPAAQIRLAVAPTYRGSKYTATTRISPDGSAVFCDAPAGVDLVLSDPQQPGVALATFRLRRGEVVGWTDRTGRRE